MFKYTCLNAISEKGTSLFGADFEKTEDIREGRGHDPQRFHA